MRELNGIEGRHRAACASKEHQVSAWAKDVQVLLKSALANAVIDHVDSLAIGQMFGFFLKILLGVNNHFIGAGFPREPGFFFRTCGANHPGANVFCHLHQKQSYAAGSSMNERGFTIL